MGALNWLTKIISGSKKGIVADIFEGIDSLVTSAEEKEELKQQALKMYIDDRQSARQMYMDDSGLQKIFAITFLLFYLALTGIMVWLVFNMAYNSLDLETWAITLISTIWGGMSAKVNTITDFLFGSSKGSQEKTQLFNPNNNQNKTN